MALIKMSTARSAVVLLLMSGLSYQVWIQRFASDRQYESARNEARKERLHYMSGDAFGGVELTSPSPPPGPGGIQSHDGPPAAATPKSHAPVPKTHAPLGLQKKAALIQQARKLPVVAPGTPAAPPPPKARHTPRPLAKSLNASNEEASEGADGALEGPSDDEASEGGLRDGRLHANRGGAGEQWNHVNNGHRGGIGPSSWDGDEEITLSVLPKTHFVLHQHQFKTDGKELDEPGKNSGRQTAYLMYRGVGPDGVQGEYEKYRFPPSMLRRLPKRDYKWAFKRCAIVSNSGSLLNTSYGGEIDEADAVFRINYAPVEGYEQDVGSKTTFDICNRPHTERVSHMSNLRQGKSTLVVFESTEWRSYYFLYKQLLDRFPPPSSIILSPDLIVEAQRLWYQLARKWPSQANSCRAIKRAFSGESGRCKNPKKRCDFTMCKPNTGWFSLFLASQICNTVDMYGFENYKFNTRMTHLTKYHYFDEVVGQTNVHSFNLTLTILRYLSDRFPIRLRYSGPNYDTHAGQTEQPEQVDFSQMTVLERAQYAEATGKVKPGNLGKWLFGSGGGGGGGPGGGASAEAAAAERLRRKHETAASILATANLAAGAGVKDVDLERLAREVARGEAVGGLAKPGRGRARKRDDTASL